MEQQGDYGAAKGEITAALMPMELVSFEQFNQRKLRPGGTMSVFVYEMKKLLDQVMPTTLGRDAHDQQ